MENIFSLTDAGMLSDTEVTVSGNGIFLLAVESGNAEISCEGSVKTLSAGEVFSGASSIGYTLSVNKDSEAILLSAGGELTKSLLSLYEITDGFLSKAPEVFETLRELMRLFSSPDTDRSGRAPLVFHELIFRLHRSAGTRLVRRTSLRIKDYIDSHIEDKIELEALSGIFFMSKTQLFRLFKEEYGVAPIKYLTGRKIELSKKLLENESLKISEIADALSFSDAKHFSKTFLKHEGMLPSEYRKNLSDK